MLPQPGQSLLLNERLWALRRVQPVEGRVFEFDVVGASPASAGMTRRLQAIRYGEELFIKQRHRGYWRAHLAQDWTDEAAGPVLHCKTATDLDLLDTHTRHPASGNLKNEFSWSYSRAAKYRQCPRAYYYHYYAAWEGWKATAPAPVKKAYLLKNLTGLSQWVGNLVHETIRFALSRLKAGEMVEEAELIRQMHTRAQSDFSDSQNGRYRQKPNRYTGFQEHYYQIDLTGETWQNAWETAKKHLQTFTRSALYAHLRRQSPATFLEIETLQSFQLAGAKVWVQMDLARREEDTIVIYDWKTGTVHEERIQQQLGVYGLYVRQTRPTVAKNTALRGIIYSVAADKIFEIDLNDALLAETQQSIQNSIAQLQSLLSEPTANLAEISRFPMIETLEVCQTCQFRELCGRDNLK